MDFQINDIVVHCREGVSKITGERVFGDKVYFVIKGENNGDDLIYVPKDNAQTLIRHIIDKETAKEIIKEMKTFSTASFNNTKQRRDNYHKRLSSGDPRDLAFLARQLYLYKKLNSEGTLVKLGPSDVMVLETATAMFYKELSLTFDISIEEVDSLISSY